jgi:hypothetical protein
MNVFDNFHTGLANPPVAEQSNALSDAAGGLSRQAKLLALGSWQAIADTARHPLDRLPELSLSAATGTALGAVSRLGASGRFVSAAIGTAMFAKCAYDEWRDARWSQLGAALKDAWRSDENMDKNVVIAKNSLGSFLVDSAIGYAGMRAGSFAAARVAPPAKLVPHALRLADKDGGAALLSVQNRFENANSFQRQVKGKLNLITHSQPAEPGAPRGDLIRIATTPDGKILLTGMDVEGHGVKAAKKALLAHKAIAEVLPDTKNKTASDILAMIDGKLSSKDELAVTAGLMKFDPLTRNLETATASSQFAYVVRANGQVRQLDREVGGLGLGTDMYTSFPRGNEVIRLSKGDTAVIASDGVFDRFGYADRKGFETFLAKTGAHPEKIREGILRAEPPPTGADDASFIIFSPLELSGT